MSYHYNCTCVPFKLTSVKFNHIKHMCTGAIFTSSRTQSSVGLMEELVVEPIRQPQFQEEVCSWGMKATGDCSLLMPIWLFRRKHVSLEQSLRWPFPIPQKTGLLFSGQDPPRLLGQTRHTRYPALWVKKGNTYQRTSLHLIQPLHFSNHHVISPTTPLCDRGGAPFYRLGSWSPDK